MNRVNMKMETTGKRILISATLDSHLTVLPLNIVLGNAIDRYEMDYKGQDGEFYKYEFMPKNNAVSKLPEIAYKDALGIDILIW